MIPTLLLYRNPSELTALLVEHALWAHHPPVSPHCRGQMPEEDLVELKFRLCDGSDIGPIRYSSSSTVAMLKERIISEWPRDKKIIPRVANDVKLISGGKILENNKTIAQCRSPFGELPAGVITMHVVVQPSLNKIKTVSNKS
ncbi:hypothetical protein C4D60_Mb11t08960 [Musa balbisiana]|uniref:Ubiquitin-like domain-containing protein n=1 Tax=Musa balbisiana TaxID=52838 RepID=A0A4S8J2Y2_MUSBA|nr:hypothetical protein C4D60_Mb11t08960 [Musa balbisiana]